MNTEGWLLILLIVTVVVGTGMYHFGYFMAKEQQKLNEEYARDLLATMRRHPSNHLRAVKE